jgi:PAS domain S-box-containing protein
MATTHFDRLIVGSATEALDFIGSLLESLPEYAIVAEDLAGRILLWNEGARRVYGYDAQEIVGIVQTAILHTPEDAVSGKLEEIRRAALDKGKWEETLTCVRKDGQRFRAHVLWTLRRDAAGRAIGFLAISNDLSREAHILQQAEHKFRGLLEAAPDAIVIADRECQIVLANAQTGKLFGYSQDELLCHNIDMLLPERLRARYKSELREFFRDPSLERMAAGMELYGRRKDATEFPADVSLGPIEASEGLLVSIAIRDITDRKRMERLRAGEARILTMIATDARLEGTLAELMLVIESQSQGMVCSALLLDEDKLHIRHGAAPSLPEAYTKAVDGASIGPRAGSCGTAMHLGKPVIVTDLFGDPLWADYSHFRNLLAPTGLRSCWSTPIFSSKGDVLGSFAIYYREPRGPNAAERHLIDVATRIAGIAIERKASQEALRKSEEEYRRFFESNLAGNWVSTPGGEILACNPAFARIFGFESVEEALACNFASLYPGPEPRQVALDRLRKQKRLEHYSQELRRRDGTAVHVIVNAIGSFDDHGNLVQIFGHLIDDTEKRKTEQQLLHAQKMEAIGRLVGGIAHDFNNILGVVIGYSNILLEQTAAEDPARRRIQEIQKAGTRAAALIRQLMAFSRRQVLYPTVLNLNTVVSNLEEMLQRSIGEDIKLTIKPDRALGLVKIDQSQIEQVIMNLVVNARDAMPQGGKLIIRTANVDLDEQAAREHPPTEAGRYVMLAVRDTGMGMDAQTRAHIFEPFFSTKEVGKGTGLGLSTVYGIVKQSSGYIWVTSEPGEGTTFEIYLPRIPGASEVASPSLHSSASSGTSLLRGSETILLVEDAAPLRTLISELLEGAGYRVLTAEGPLDAIQVAQGHKGPITLLITDVVMPDMSGQLLAERLTLLSPSLKVLYISGYADREATQSKSDILSAKAVFLQKPFSKDDILRRMREILDVPAAPPAG